MTWLLLTMKKQSVIVLNYAVGTQRREDQWRRVGYWLTFERTAEARYMIGSGDTGRGLTWGPERVRGTRIWGEQAPVVRCDTSHSVGEEGIRLGRVEAEWASRHCLCYQ